MRMLTMVIEISRSELVSRDRFILVEPAELVEEIAELYEPVAEEAGLDFTVAIDASAPAMTLHRELISQAITNLIDNALNHAASGGESRCGSSAARRRSRSRSRTAAPASPTPTEHRR